MSELTIGTLERGFRLGNWLVRPCAGELVSPWPRRAVEHVEPRAMQVLLALARHPGQFLSKDELLETVWARGPVTEDCLTRAIYNLRQAVGDNPRNPDYIETRQNVGYRLIASVQPDKAAKRTWIGAFALAALFALTTIGLVFYHDPAVSDYRENSIAVLPFVNLSEKGQQDYLSAALTDTLILNLARWPQLRVTSRTSVMPYAGSDASAKVIAEQLGVHLLVEGSVFASDERLRITAGLVDPRTGRHLWTRQFDRAFDDVLDLQNEISMLIAQQVGGLIVDPPQQQLQLPADSMKTFLQARYELALENPADVRNALERFEELTHIHNEFGPAYLGKAQALLTLFKYRELGVEALESASEAAHHAEILGITSSELHRCLGQIILFRSWDFSGAEQRYARALALSPSDTVAIRRYAWLLVARQRYDEAHFHVRQLRLLDPMYYESPEMAMLLLYARQTDQAIAEFERLDATIETGPAILRLMAVAYWQAEREADLRNTLQRLLEAGADLSVMDRHSLQGLSAPALYREILRRRAYTARSPVVAATWHALIGETAPALNFLEDAVRARDPSVIYLGALPEFSSLHSTARFQQMLTTLGVSHDRWAAISNPQ